MKDSDRKPERFLRAKEVIRRLGVSKSTFFVMVGEGRFPQGVKITANCVGWREAVVDAWIVERETAA
jgi:prophage regulatory protein